MNREFKDHREFRARLVRRDRKETGANRDLKVNRGCKVPKVTPAIPGRRARLVRRVLKVTPEIPGRRDLRENRGFRVPKATPEKPGLKVLRESKAKPVRRDRKETGANRDRLAKPWWSVPWNMEQARPGHWQ